MGAETCEYKSAEKEDNKDKLPERVEESIRNIIAKEGYKNPEVLTRAISTGGGNYFGTLHEVDVKEKTSEGEKETHLFIKSIPPCDHFTVISVPGMFMKELFFYNELSVVFNEIQDEAGVPQNERYKVIKNYQESIPEAIILENAARKGYKTMYRMDPISLKFAQLAIQQLGKFHGLSFALAKKRPEYFEENIKTIHWPLNFNEDIKDLLNNSANAIIACLDDDAKRRLKDNLPKLFEKLSQYTSNEKYKRTIVHCDYRANNILMKEIDGDIVDVIPVDYQLLYYGCPLADFFFFIFLGTDQQFRREHLEDLKDLYFESITKILNYFNIDVKSVFPREDFEDLYHETLDFGLISFIQMMPFIFAVDNEIPELDKEDLSDVVIKADPRMAERARGIVDDYIRWGVL